MLKAYIPMLHLWQQSIHNQDDNQSSINPLHHVMFLVWSVKMETRFYVIKIVFYMVGTWVSLHWQQGKC